MPDELEFPIPEREIRDHLAAATPWPWVVDAGNDTTAGMGVVQVTGGAAGANAYDVIVDVETVVFAAGRSGIWTMAKAVEKAMLALASDWVGDVYVDDVEMRFRFAVEPPSSAGFREARATWSLTVRKQPAIPAPEPDPEP